MKSAVYCSRLWKLRPLRTSNEQVISAISVYFCLWLGSLEAFPKTQVFHDGYCGHVTLFLGFLSRQIEGHRGRLFAAERAPLYADKYTVLRNTQGTAPHLGVLLSVIFSKPHLPPCPVEIRDCLKFSIFCFMLKWLNSSPIVIILWSILAFLGGHFHTESWDEDYRAWIMHGLRGPPCPLKW